MTFTVRNTLSLSLLLALVALMACRTDSGASREGASSTHGEREEVGTTPAEEQAPMLSDNEIAGVLASVHEGEISHARLVRDRSSAPRVLAFTEQMIADHGRALNELDALRGSAGIIPETSTLQQELTGEALNMEQTLAAADPGEIDRIYMSGQVRMHERALDIADTELLPAAQSAELGAYLRRLRPVLQRHLEMAREIDREQTVASAR